MNAIENAKGEKGGRGEQGPQGEKCPKGDKGEQGPQGTIDKESVKAVMQEPEIMKMFEDNFQEKTA